ncbi:hypothetical protein [Gracilibacillus salinarum]|uniref:Scaffolding protein n=1 Tax=Gracilibacillus salinarum TaxID=2932255 RepID=A0ABY4GPB7_9BACI|nr:hypothetical protein [Gracilibacillus salinarum]UOQ86200.1 hypothetical protein MUN87_04695 [Gracilibacillus salinarum]
MSEEQPNYRELFEQLQANIDADKQQATKDKKRKALTDAGYTEEQADKYLPKVVGDTSQEFKESVEILKEDIPPTKKYVEPSLGNGKQNQPKKKDKAEIGREAVRRLKAKGMTNKFYRGV